VFNLTTKVVNPFRQITGKAPLRELKWLKIDPLCAHGALRYYASPAFSLVEIAFGIRIGQCCLKLQFSLRIFKITYQCYCVDRSTKFRYVSSAEQYVACVAGIYRLRVTFGGGTAILLIV